jgi:hypothetical protein
LRAFDRRCGLYRKGIDVFKQSRLFALALIEIYAAKTVGFPAPANSVNRR